uniref:Uncharacterized protein n=1 Tax=Globisporangium ultimum (strain ATCC 200006 / CBS 805.95 / DAOM BR144) TaxID=431595 RepID=K3WHG5_GLOUD
MRICLRMAAEYLGFLTLSSSSLSSFVSIGSSSTSMALSALSALNFRIDTSKSAIGGTYAASFVPIWPTRSSSKFRKPSTRDGCTDSSEIISTFSRSRNDWLPVVAGTILTSNARTTSSTKDAISASSSAARYDRIAARRAATVSPVLRPFLLTHLE